MVRPRIKGKPEKEETSGNKDASDVLGSARKLGSNMTRETTKNLDVHDITE